MTQFCIKQMMNSGMFKKLELKECEKKDEADKMFYDTTDYFEEVIADNETCDSNAGGTVKRSEFKSTMQVKDMERPDADTGNNIRSYTEDLIASNSVDK